VANAIPDSTITRIILENVRFSLIAKALISLSREGGRLMVTLPKGTSLLGFADFFDFDIILLF